MSTLEVSNLNDGTTTVATTFVTNGSAKVWANINGTGTIAARDSNNVSSLTDNGTGDYQINISSAMNNSNYYVGESGANNTTQEIRHNNGLTRATTAVQIDCRANNSNTYADPGYAGVSLQGDLA
tara:strand:- start:30 stop:404 length:375 start_codon:yes stop_codon:yes gene_type:complete